MDLTGQRQSMVARNGLTGLTVLAAFGLATAAAAQALPDPGSAKPGNPQGVNVDPPASPAAAAESEIVVRGTLERKSSWRRAEGAHAIVYSNGDEAELRRVTANLDREYYLLSRIFGLGDQPDDTRKIEVVVTGGTDFGRSLKLRNIRAEEGPYADPFRFQRFYDPRDTGALMVVGRSDQAIPVAADLASVYQSDAIESTEDDNFPDDVIDPADSFDDDPFPTRGGTSGLHRSIRPPQAMRPWEALLYSGFAQHFVLTHAPAGYPRWYLDGVGALFSTMKVRADGTIEYGRTPEAFAAVINSYPSVPVSDALSGKTQLTRKSRWSPYQAWVAAHYLFFGTLSAERRGQFVRYMADVAAGVAPATAVAHFGDLKALDAEIAAYGKGNTFFYAMPGPAGFEQPAVTALSLSEAALLKNRVLINARIDAPERNDAKRDAFLASLSGTLAKIEARPAADLLLAEAACRAGRPAPCAEAADRVLARDAGDAAALGWKATALVEQAIAAPAEQRDAAFAAARAGVIAANRADTDNPVPLIAYFRLYSETGRVVPKPALMGMLKAIELVPPASTTRLALGRELVKQGMLKDARRILLPVAAGGYDTPEKAEARQLLGLAPVVAGS